jgi:hypothetical protein
VSVCWVRVPADPSSACHPVTKACRQPSPGLGDNAMDVCHTPSIAQTACNKRLMASGSSSYNSSSSSSRNSRNSSSNNVSRAIDSLLYG